MRYAILLALLLPLLAVCSGGGEGPKPTVSVSPSPAVARPSPTPEATEEPTPTPEPTEPTPEPTPATVAVETRGFDGFRTFAPEIEVAVEARDVGFFLSRALLSTVTCPNEFEPRCQGLPDGATVDGVWLGKWGSEGSLLSLDGLRANLSEYFGSLQEPALLGIAGLNGDAGGIIGGPASFAIAGPSRDSTQSVRAFQFVFIHSKWHFKATIGVPGEQWLAGNCTECYDEFERWVEATS